MIENETLRRLAPAVFAALACVLLGAAAAAADAEPAPEDSAAAAEEQGRAVGLSRSVAEKLTKAIELYEADRFDEALAIVDALGRRRRQRPPDLAQVHRFRGYILLSKGNGEGAAQEFRKALAQRALDPFAEQQTTYSLAQLYTQLGEYDQALELIDAWFAAAQQPKPEAYFLKAMILVQQKKFREALEPATLAVGAAAEPRESWVQLLVAIQIELENFEEVAKNLERLVAIAPGKKQYWVQLAAVQNHLKQDAKALATLRLAERAELLSEDRDFRQLARLLFVRELPFQCAREIEAALASGALSADADSYRMLSNCWIAAREPERALEPLAKAGELSEDGEMYMLLGQLHLQRERYEPALEALGRALARSKPEQRGSVQLLIGVAQLGTNRFDEAERAFRAAATDPKVGDAARSYLKFVEEQRLREQQQEEIRPAETFAQR